MSVAVIAPSMPVSPNGQAISAVEYVNRLSVEEREEVLFALIKELIEVHGGGHGLISIDREGESLGYLVPPKAAAERYKRFMEELPPEVRESLLEPLPPGFSFDDVLSEEELQKLIDETHES